MVQLSGNYEAERALVVFNEYGSSARRMRQQIEQLTCPVEVVSTQADFRYTEDEVIGRARGGDVIFGAGGDGTANYIGNLVMSDAFHEAGHGALPFVPLRGGNANDLAVMLNGRRTAADILRSGRYAQMKPLETVYSSPAEAGKRYAFAYFSIGATALASERLEMIKNTANKLTRSTGFQQAREAFAAWQSLSSAPDFKVTQAGEAPEVYADLLFIKGNRMAKYGRPHASLAAGSFETIASRLDGPLSVITNMLALQRGKKYGQLLASACFSAESADNAPLLAQYDGETAYIPSGSDVRVRVPDEGYYTLTTRTDI